MKWANASYCKPWGTPPCSVLNIRLGELTPNTVVVGWPEVASHAENERLMHESQNLWQITKRMGLSCLICKGLNLFPNNYERVHGRCALNQVLTVCSIDVWWIVEDGQLLLLIAYLLKQHAVWQHCTIRLYTLCHSDDNPIEVEEEIRAYLIMLRIKASD